MGGSSLTPQGLMVVNKIPSVVRSYFSQATSLTFPAGGLVDQLPIINLALANEPATERIDKYFDLGPTDAAKDLDVIDGTTVVPIYLDPAYLEPGDTPAMTGVLPPKCVLLRCLAGSGLLYINAPYPLDETAMAKCVPLPLHAGKGLFSYAFPRSMSRYTVAADPADPTVKITVGLALTSLYLRTFEDGNRFQLVVFK
jgi:hypothetical protein